MARSVPSGPVMVLSATWESSGLTESGSSMSHLNDDYYTGANEKLMNASSDTGLGVRTLSPIEIGIMKDLGYTMVSASPTVAVLFIGLMLVRRRRQ